MKKYISDIYNNLLKNKKVVIVGSAGYLQGKKLGTWIDKFDIVVRINFGVSILKGNREDLGSKTDIVYNYLSDSMFTNEQYVNDLINAKTKYIITMHFTYQAQIFRDILKNRIPHELIATSFFQGINKQMYLAPQTGTAGIRHLLITDLKSLNVIGFDYYESGCYDGYDKLYGNKAINRNTKDHDYRSQLKYISKIKDDRLILDDALQNMINKEISNGSYRNND